MTLSRDSHIRIIPDRAAVRSCLEMASSMLSAQRYAAQRSVCCAAHSTVQQSALVDCHLCTLHLPALSAFIAPAMSCSRVYCHAVGDDVVLALFAPDSRYKARRVTRLLGLKRSRHRIVTAQLNHLVHQGRLQQLPSTSSRYTQSLYALHLSLSAPSPSPSAPCPSPLPCPVAPSSPVPTFSAEVPLLQCLCCQSATPTVVCLPCRHQRCCVECWEKVEQRERSVFNKHHRLKQQLSMGPRQRRPTFKPRCPVCRDEVDDVIQTFMD